MKISPLIALTTTNSFINTVANSANPDQLAFIHHANFHEKNRNPPLVPRGTEFRQPTVGGKLNTVQPLFGRTSDNEERPDAKTDPKEVSKRTIKIQALTDTGIFSDQNRVKAPFRLRTLLKQPQEYFSIKPVPENWAGNIKDLRDLGPYDVEDYFVNTTIASTNRQVVGHIFSPNPSQLNESTPLVVVIPPGFVGGIDTLKETMFFDIQFYESYMKHMASYGFTVFGLYEQKGAIFSALEAVDHGRDALELSSLLDSLVSQESPIKSPIDPSRIALMGHSKGAKLSYLAAVNDKRIGVILAIDPVNVGGPPSFISRKAYDNPVAPIPDRLSVDEAPLNSVEAAICLFRAPPDIVNTESQFNAEHFWEGQKSDGFYVDLDVKHAAWLFNKELKGATRALFTAWLFRHFTHIDQFENYLSETRIREMLPNTAINQVDEKRLDNS